MDNDQPVEEMTLTFIVPETDFDGISLEIALHELEERVQRYEERDNHGLRAAYRILHKVHIRYVETLGKPEWRKPNALEGGEEADGNE